MNDQKTKVRASLLAYTLAISIVISTLIGTMILLGYYYRTSDQIRNANLELIDNVRSGEQLPLSNPAAFDYFDLNIFDFFENQRDSVSIQKLPWGFYDHFRVTAFRGPRKKISHFSLAYTPDSLMTSALYLVDDRRPLSVSGGTRISGVLYLPQSGVQSAFINRQGYQNDSLFYGSKYVSKDDMPAITEEFLEGWEKLGEYPIFQESPGYSLRHSFFNDTLIKVLGNPLSVADTLEGKIWIEGKNISFESSARTQDILVQAKTIRLKKGFVGSGQFFAEDSLIIEESVTLNYPSVACVYNDKNVGIMRIHQGAQVHGVIVLHGDPNLYTQRQLYIEDGATVFGALYCHGYLEHYGLINGHASVRKTLVSTQEGIYENYLLNAEIDGNAFPKGLLIPDLWYVGEKRKVLTWYQ